MNESTRETSSFCGEDGVLIFIWPPLSSWTVNPSKGRQREVRCLSLVSIRCVKVLFTEASLTEVA